MRSLVPSDLGSKIGRFLSDHSLDLACGLLATFLVGIYNSLWYTRYAPLPEGWFSVYADLIRKGEIPYRDFYLYLPPLYPLLLAAFQSVFGPSIIVLRIFGFLIMLLFSASLYEISRRCFGALAALFVSVVSVVYYESSNTHIGYDFIQVMNLAALLACLSLMRLREAVAADLYKQQRAWAFVAGALAAAAFLTKHSNGLFIGFACGVAALISGSLGSRKFSLLPFFWFISGLVTVGFAIALWLFVHGALGSGIRMILGGASAKGGIGRAVFGFVPTLFTVKLYSIWLELFILSLPLGLWGAWSFAFHVSNGASSVSHPKRFELVFGISVLLLAAILVPFRRDGGIPPWVPILMQDYVTVAMIPAAILSSILIIAGYIYLATRCKTPAASRRVIPAIVSLGMLWGNGTSGGLSESGAFLGFALFLGALVDCGGFFRLGSVAVGVAMLLETSLYAEVKYHNPYYWWGVEEADVRLELVPAEEPIQRGLWMSQGDNRIYTTLTSLIRKNTVKGDRILVFPQTPIFYLMADRRIMGKAVIHWFDVLPDKLALDEDLVLRENPPRLIVIMDMPEQVWSVHEELFRNGLPCAQRQIVATVAKMEAEGSFSEIATVPISRDYRYRILLHK